MMRARFDNDSAWRMSPKPCRAITRQEAVTAYQKVTNTSQAEPAKHKVAQGIGFSHTGTRSAKGCSRSAGNSSRLRNSQPLSLVLASWS